ncbi:hypothetical protein IJG72_07010 [bacterium]|nr:hypothetical protein [bacterium]
MNRNFDFNEFKNNLSNPKSANFICLKNDIDKIENFIENALSLNFESSQSKVERDFNVNIF